ncbi:MAG TPA: hypothetical protein VGZ47_01795, partial [Gemmataceae bacterium]|nr:hypothetical protein [Gemmataceae bacterium]
MRKTGWWLWLGLGVVVAAIAVAVAVRRETVAGSGHALDVPAGDQEIAWFHTTTNSATWERFVTGVHYAVRQEPRLHVDDSRAFLDQTTAVPEIVLSWQGSDHRLFIRWYKQSSQMKVDDWVRALAERDPPPLAILGGGSSDRALELAQALARRSQWRGSPPLMLLTTATANTVYIENQPVPQDLMHVYPERSFRFCFTNRQMAHATLDFVWRMPNLRPQGNSLPSLAAVTQAAAGDLWGSAGWLLAQSEFPPEVFALEWKDDPYSVDLSEQFRGVFYDRPDDTFTPLPLWQQAAKDRSIPPLCLPIRSSVGGFIRPNEGEANAIDLLLSDPPQFPLPRSIPRQPLQRSLLILPAVVQPGRRVLSGLTGSVPFLGRHLVAVSGDSISFNNIYRDADLMWNIRLVPVPLVFFTHQNPVAWDAEAPQLSKPERFPLYPPNGTDDVLHFADTARILADAVFPAGKNGGPLAANADEFRDRLRQRMPAFFDK